MKKIISEEVLDKIIERAYKRVMYEEYHLDDIEELYVYTLLGPNKTGLNVPLFLDNGETYKMYNHQLLVLVRNGYSDDIMEFIPFAVSERAEILDTSIECNLRRSDVNAIQTFIRLNVEQLKLLADGRLRGPSFINSLSVPAYTMREEKEVLSEMSMLRPDETNLPMTIWVDEGNTFQRHAPRLKFKASPNQHNSKEFSSMTLSNDPQIFNLPKDTNLSSKDLELLKTFVKRNLNNLLLLSTNQIDFSDDFLPNIIKV